MRNDFDYQAECGVWQCLDCEEVFYPMELIQGSDLDEDEKDRVDVCPSCLGDCETYIMDKATFDETELNTWFERDRAHVELRDRRTDKTLVEWWDEEVGEAIEDGFLKSRDLHGTAYEYWDERW